ncbi:C4-dicarboxylate ABC transporter [Amaricoccus solimangrovi]|uniref:C4-dicarboxylate ABC transporter n=1 Tax=Amaricoccus solimangrovi TaxID=2589815 RepID=A0A501WJL0_9RHOB|nr:C4-dicarboxylate ABC transporter [Amaricoccus solimangrovi]TPE49709.1 C4-dicarboxylate ABC transporter [Amaricoccus solimangrovi]
MVEGRVMETGPELRGIVRRFTPNWFAVTMGTGGLALVLRQVPGAGLDAPALALWLLATVLFAVFSVLYAARWILFPREAARILAHPVMSMFLGTIPMGLTTVANGFLAFGPGLIGAAALPVALTLWAISAALALACGLGVPYLMFTRQEHGLERMTAVWLLPLVAAEVAAAGAAGLAPHLAGGAAAAMVIGGYVLWALSVPLAMSVLALLFLRLALHRLPEAEVGPSAWLTLGPIGTGALGLLLLGEAAPAAFAGGPLAAAGGAAFGLGILGGLVLWGYGLWWLGLALLKTARYLRSGLPFSLAWWAFTFPLAVFTLATLALGRLTGLGAFDLGGTLLAWLLAGLWLIVATRTARGALRGTLFFSPCLAGAPR